MLNMKLIFFDTETSGLNCRSSRIIELAMLTVVDGKIIDEYDEFVDIGERLDPKITELTGITDNDLDEKGLYEDVIADDLMERLTPGTVMIAHNCQFDLSFVYHLLKRHYPNEAYETLASLKWIDTVTILKDCKDYPHKLIDAVEFFELEKVNFHRAIDDTKALYDVFQKLKEIRPVCEYKNLFGYNPKWGIKNNEKFEFINYMPQPYHNRGQLPLDEILPRKKSNF